MSSNSIYLRLPVSSTFQQFFWMHPEWWAAGLSGFAWIAILLHSYQRAGHGWHHQISWSQEFQYWILMVTAMMLPLVMDRLRLAAQSSLWAGRHRAIATFLLGYLTPWLGLGVLVVCMNALASIHSPAGAALVFVGAAVWQRTSAHARAMAACHRRRPLAPNGWRQYRDCFAYGNSIGIACVASCWPLMLACAFSGHGLVAMAGGMGIGIAERWPFRPRTRVMLCGTLAIAGYYGILTALSLASPSDGSLQ